MKLKDLAEKALANEEDGRFFGWCGDIPRINNIWSTHTYPFLQIESFRISDKSRWSFEIDGEYIPFANVREKKNLFGTKYNIELQILPCMIPKAVESLAKYVQDCYSISGANASNSKAGLQEANAIRDKLYNLLESNLPMNQVNEENRNIA